MKKVIIFLILIALLGGGYWYFSNQNKHPIEVNPSADWQTFRSEKYGYEVSYPYGLEPRALSEGKTVYFLPEDFLGVSEAEQQEAENSAPSGFGLSSTIMIDQANNPKSLALKSWLDENIFSGHRSVTPSGGKEITLAGEPAYHIEQNHDGRNGGLYAYTRYTIYTLHNGNLYQISGVKLPQSPTPAWLAHPYYQYLEKSIPISEAILNSFKFTN